MPGNKTVDPRRRRSRESLESALLRLLADRPMGDIAISDVAKSAGVNRSTFYEHYRSVSELAARACTRMFDELIAMTPALGVVPQDKSDGGHENPLVELFAHVEQHAHLYRALLGPSGSAQVIWHLRNRIAIAIHVNRRLDETPVRTHADDPATIPHDPAAAALAGALVGTVADWLERGCPGTSRQIAAEVWPLFLDVG